MDILAQINQYMHVHSHFDRLRDYLGISQVAGCPRRAYSNYVEGYVADEAAYRMSFAGYEQEQSMRSMLGDQLVEINRELVAPFDNRLRGHIDGSLRARVLVEFKSVSVRKFETVSKTGKALTDHFHQCQLYMRYGSYVNGLIIYRCRETYQHAVIEVHYYPSIAQHLEEKARMILDAIDQKIPPDCECGYCLVERISR